MTNDKKKTSQIVLVIAAVIGGVIPTLLNTTLFSKEAKLEKAIVQAANVINQNCPMVVDTDTRLDNANAMPGNTLRYNYTLVNFMSPGLDKAKFKKEFTPILINKFKNNPDMAEFFKNGCSVVCRYNANDGVHIADISIHPQMVGY